MKRGLGLAFVILAGCSPIAAATAQSSSTTLVPTAIQPTSSTVSPEEEFSRLLADAQKAYTAVNDYVSTIVMQERIGSELQPRKAGIFKFMKPFSIYIKWREGPQTGTEVLYVAGQNKGKLLAHQPGLLTLATFHLEPTSKLALSDSRHPITEAGIGFTQDLLESNRKRAMAAGVATARRRESRDSIQPPGIRFELIVNADEKAGYYCRRAIVTFDPKTRLMVAVQIYDWTNRLVEDYRFLNVRLNVGLTERDFSPDNPEYGF